MEYIVSFPALLGLYLLLVTLWSLTLFHLLKEDWSGIMKRNPVLYVVIELCIIAYIQIFSSIYILYIR